jgi:HK97 family phage major capsid protein
VSEFHRVVEDLGSAFDEFKANHVARLDQIEAKINRQALGGLGQPYNAAASTEAKRAGDAYIRRGAVDGTKAMSIGSDPDGGVTVTSYLAPDIYAILREISPMRQICRVVPLTNSDAFEEVQDRGSAPGYGWVGESESRPATTSPTLGKLRIQPREVYAMPETTQQLLDDSNFNIEAYLAGKVAEQFAIAEGQAFWAGDGVSQPRGLSTYPVAATPDGSRPWGTFEFVATGASGAFNTASQSGAEIFHDAVSKLKLAYRPRARWVMNRTTFAACSKIKDTTGRFVLQTDIAGVPATLLGFPVTLCEDVPDIGANSLSIAFGDFTRGYTVVDRVGIRVLRDPFSNKPFVRFYTTMRVGGDVSDFNAIKFVRFSS